MPDKERRAFPVKILVGIVIFLVGVSAYFLFGDPTPPRDVVITMERTVCYGACPAYRLTIYGNGRIVYEGKKNVKVEGTRTGHISKRQVRELVAEFERIKFFDLEDEYIAPATDLPSTTTSITLEGRKKSIENYGWLAPQELADLEMKIDKTTNSVRWVGRVVETFPR
jgi:hypothetical protein